ncbi:MAG TPA: hypothetical protein VKQ36_17695 [Ktedonobacterales bacterium]|nr:hypothetical protein [Ktedonobacterales bacterium]
MTEIASELEHGMACVNSLCHTVSHEIMLTTRYESPTVMNTPITDNRSREELMRSHPSRQRPLDVIVLALLALLGGVASLLSTLLTLLAGDGGLSELTALPFGIAFLLLVAVLVGLGGSLLSLVFGIGAFWGARWAWRLGFFAEGISVLASVAAMSFDAAQRHIGLAAGITQNLVGLAIAAFLLAYLNVASVKAYFGRA